METTTKATKTAAIQSGTFEMREFCINGRSTRIRLEVDFWTALEDIAKREQVGFPELITMLVERRDAFSSANFAAVARSFAIAYARSEASEEGHRRAGHGTVNKRDSPRLVLVKGGIG